MVGWWQSVICGDEVLGMKIRDISGRLGAVVVSLRW